MSHGLQPHWKPFVVTTTIDDLPPDGQRLERISRPKPWRPVTLRRTYLAALIVTTIGLIVVVQWLLYISRRDQGIIFAEDINDLPLRRSFYYLYLPTIISVIYSFLWTWVDLDIKRLEPYFQLSKHEGALGSSSILLSYPLEFLVTIPLSAFKRKHWTVFAASMASILILGGLTPSQAGIFAVRTVKISSAITDLRSTGYATLNQQGNVSSVYAQSVYNIAWLNESLPPFMTKDYVLSPFGPAKSAPSYAVNVSYSGQSMLYSVDISCENVTMWPRDAGAWYNSSSGCSFMGPAYRSFGGDDVLKPFDAMYVGYQNQGGFADYYLSSYCDERFFHNFFVRWSKANSDFIVHNNTDALAPGQANETALFCTPTYFRQKVNATIALPSQEVLHVKPAGEKLSLPANLFNSSTFEWAMSSGQAQFITRGTYPVSGFPDQKSQLVNTSLNTAYIPKMAPFAIATHQRPMEEYMDPETLRASYQSAYRLLFSRLLVDVLASTMDSTSDFRGQHSYITQGVVIVPVFAWISTSLLVVIFFLAVYLFFQCPRRSNKLQDDPGTLNSLVNMVTGGPNATLHFSRLNGSCTEKLDGVLKGDRFHLITDGKTSLLRAQQRLDITANTSEGRDISSDDDFQGVRPGEMKLVVGALFFIIQMLAIVAFAILLYRARNYDGLPLPSRSSFVRQLVEKYIPIALATFIEPFWLVLNRLLCLLQPFEELRKGHRPASKSTDLNYSSLPPQLVLGKALRAGHLILTAVCLMTLMANVLAVALGGLMYEDDVTNSRMGVFRSTKSAKFRTLNGTGLPFNTDQASNSQGGTTFEPFYRQMSNDTAGTPLPAWTDTSYAYVPMDLTGTEPDDMIWLQTTAFGAEANCRTLESQGLNNYSMSFDIDASEAFIHVEVAKDDGSSVNCSNFAPWTRTYAVSGQYYLKSPQAGTRGIELNGWLSNANKSTEDDLFCRQHILLGWLRTEWQVRTGRDGGLSIDRLPKLKLKSHNETMLLCRPSISVATADIKVDPSGQVYEAGAIVPSSAQREQYFGLHEQDLVAQANQFFIDSDATWHSDAFPSDFINYLIIESTNDTSLVDSSLPAPDPELAAVYVTAIYKRVFALLVSTYSDVLFEDESKERSIEATVETPKTRILLSMPAFIVAESILACYVLVTIIFYARRPWRVLPRLPSSMASIIAYFAASQALDELTRLRKRSSQAPTRILMSSWTWSYGYFSGTDGRSHLGIERAEFVTAVDRHSLTSRRMKDET